MSLAYNVAIIDDQKGFYDDYKVIIEEHLSKQGFIAKVDYINSDLDFAKYEISKPDLYMVDLKFGHIDQGQEFIKKIRKDYYTDILFYSSDHEAIQKYRQSAEMQGIYFAEKDEQTGEVDNLLKGLLDKMVLKSNSPRSTRGIVMECVSELDESVRNKIILLVKKIPDGNKQIIEKEILKLFNLLLSALQSINSRISGWSTLNIPILAPRLVPPCFTASVAALNTSINETGPEDIPIVECTTSFLGLNLEKEKPVPPPDWWIRAVFLIVSNIPSNESSIGNTKQAANWPSSRPAFISVGEFGINWQFVIAS